jgi:hypothetical protein
MSTKPAVQQNTAPAAKAGGIDEFLGGDAPSDWNETGTQNLYKPDAFVATRIGKMEACWREEGGKKIPTAPAIQGYPVAVTRHEGEEGPFEMVQIQLTRRTAVVDKQGTLIPCEVGETLKIVATKALERVALLARLPNHSVECVLRPIQREDIGGGHTMWRWSVKENPKPVARVRAAAEDIAAQFDFPEPSKALPENATATAAS